MGTVTVGGEGETAAPAPARTRPDAQHLASGVAESGAAASDIAASDIEAQAASGIDCDAFLRDVYDRYGPLLLRYATRLLDGDRHKGEDILQETAVRAWKHVEFLAGSSELLRPWLFTVARNLVVDHHRSRGRRPLEVEPGEEPDASRDTTASVIDALAVSRALGQLTEQQQAVIRLMYHLECSVQQAAEHLLIPPGTVKSRAFYAVRALRRELGKQGVPGP